MRLRWRLVGPVIVAVVGVGPVGSFGRPPAGRLRLSTSP